MKKRIIALCLSAVVLGSAAASTGCIASAIAAPAVVGITNNANNSQKESDAAQLTSAVKSLYAGVVSGTITKETPDDELNGLASRKYSVLPSKNDPVATKKEMANALIVQDAIDYSGLYTKFDSSNIGEYVYDPYDTAVYYAASIKSDEIKLRVKPLTLSTTLGEMRGQ